MFCSLLFIGVRGDTARTHQAIRKQGGYTRDYTYDRERHTEVLGGEATRQVRGVPPSYLREDIPAKVKVPVLSSWTA